MTTPGTPESALFQRLATALAPAGLALRGGFHADPGEPLPQLADGGRPQTVLLVGNAGPAMWRAFRQSGAGGPDPLDAWTRRTVAPVAAAVGGSCVFPFDGPPFWPFQTWAQRAEPVRPSPLGLLIHPVYGLWHAYRAALLLAEQVDLPDPVSAGHPCEGCAGRPCLSACPVDAFDTTGFDVRACSDHVAGRQGDCHDRGCWARRACPVGREHVYSDDQAAFHMVGFLRLAT